jgi:hypothetical protein
MTENHGEVPDDRFGDEVGRFARSHWYATSDMVYRTMLEAARRRARSRMTIERVHRHDREQPCNVGCVTIVAKEEESGMP